MNVPEALGLAFLLAAFAVYTARVLGTLHVGTLHQTWAHAVARRETPHDRHIARVSAAQEAYKRAEALEWARYHEDCCALGVCKQANGQPLSWLISREEVDRRTAPAFAALKERMAAHREALVREQANSWAIYRCEVPDDEVITEVKR